MIIRRVLTPGREVLKVTLQSCIIATNVTHVVGIPKSVGGAVIDLADYRQI